MEGLLTKNFPLNFVKISEIGYTDFPIEIYGKTWQRFEKNNRSDINSSHLQGRPEAFLSFQQVIFLHNHSKRELWNGQGCPGEFFRFQKVGTGIPLGG